MKFVIVSLFILLTINIQQTRSAPTPTPPRCNGTIIVNPPNDLTKPYYWPAGWNENLEAPAHYIYHGCSFAIKVPKGLYAKVNMKGKMDGDSLIFVNDRSAFFQYLAETNLESYFFPSDLSFVGMESGQNATTGTFGLKITWSNFPMGTPSKLNVYPDGGPAVQPTDDANNGLVISTTEGSQVSLVPVPLNSTSQGYLRNTLVFDGPTFYANFIGNLQEFYAHGMQCVSTGNKLTLITLESQNIMNMYLAQDYATTRDIVQYSAVTCDALSKCQVFMDANLGKSAVVSVTTGEETLVSVDLDKKATLSVYANSITDSKLLNTYTNATAQALLPRTYAYYIKQFVVDTGYAELNLSRN